ncbi:DUF421 domain-containing protein [Oceanobacillus iheyensis]|uniref:DUF421 domain-containing protein n=1 Tax=Oceanobacillus iheyensis TaxID=182710 RepID=UPI003641BCDA
MEWDWIWKAVLIVVAGTLLLRIAGRKSISQMTLAQTVIMIGIGSLLIQPIAGKSVWVTIGVGLILILTLIVMEFIQIKSDKLEKFLTGKSIVVIEDGLLNETNLRKLRLTVDQLEMNLRQQNVSSVKDIRWATLESNGKIGFVLKEEAKPATKKDIEELKQMLFHYIPKEKQADFSDELFVEVRQKEHKTNPPKHLR